MRELVVLGTAGQVPTRDRNLNGYLLRWDDEALLFDPGEGTQRQMLLAGVKATSITRILLTHFHGDHCLGLPGVVQRLALDGVTRPVRLYYPASGHGYLERLLGGSAHFTRAPLEFRPGRTAGTRRPGTASRRYRRPSGAQRAGGRVADRGAGRPPVHSRTAG